jgi:serine/threonine protein kinase
LVKLADFGLARSLSQSVVSGAKTRVGSDWYYSPEKATLEAYRGGDDVWAAGCVLLELCKGSRVGMALWSAEASTRREELFLTARQKSPLMEKLARGMLQIQECNRMESVDVIAEMRAASKQVSDASVENGCTS